MSLAVLQVLGLNRVAPDRYSLAGQLNLILSSILAVHTWIITEVLMNWERPISETNSIDWLSLPILILVGGLSSQVLQNSSLLKLTWDKQPFQGMFALTLWHGYWLSAAMIYISRPIGTPDTLIQNVILFFILPVYLQFFLFVFSIPTLIVATLVGGLTARFLSSKRDYFRNSPQGASK